MTKPPTVNYALRAVDAEIWRRFKSRAAGEGRTIRFVLLELIRVYARHGFLVVETFDGHRER